MQFKHTFRGHPEGSDQNFENGLEFENALHTSYRFHIFYTNVFFSRNKEFTFQISEK
jgi:hypothetical protein